MQKSKWLQVTRDRADFSFDMSTAIRIDSRSSLSKGFNQTLSVEEDFSYNCREELIADVRMFLTDIVDFPTNNLNLFREADRQADKTYFIAFHPICKRLPCINELIHALDCIVTVPALLLNPDRYLGNWWQTTPESAYKHKFKGAGGPFGEGPYYAGFKYSGVDNTILYHPALLSILLGLFRQAILLFEKQATQELENLIPRSRLVKAVNSGNVEECLEIAELSRPWIEAGSRDIGFPIRSGEWQDFLNLHNALYKHGFDGVFGSPEHAWSLEEPYAYFDQLGIRSFLTKYKRTQLAQLAAA